MSDGSVFQWVLGVTWRYEEICISHHLPGYSVENSVGGRERENSSRQVRRLLQDPGERCAERTGWRDT